MRSSLIPTVFPAVAAALVAGPLASDTQAQTRNYDIEWMRGQGTTISGDVAADQVGDVLAVAGDMNNDGFDDLVLTAWRRENAGLINTGRAWIVYGGAGFPGSTIGVSDVGVTEILPDTTQDSGFSGPQLGLSASTAGDINNDGFDDVIIGSPRSDPNGTDSGIAYVIYGAASMPATIDLETLGSAGVAIQGANGGDLAGQSVSGGGDVNNDGFDDVVVGAQGADPNGSNSGAVYIVYGSATLPNAVDLGDLSTTSGLGVIIEGASSADRLGATCAMAGDIDDDGFDDVLAGAPDADPLGRINAGLAVLVYGGSALADVIDSGSVGAAGATIIGALPGHQVSTNLAGGGDVNADGFEELILGSQLIDTPNGSESGRAYVLLGSDSLGSTIDLASASGVIRIDGAGADDNAGSAVSIAGDVNRDGFDDIALGVQNGDPTGASNGGQVAIVYGDATLSGVVDLGSLAADGVILDGFASQDLLGSSVDITGDFDGDGFDDVLMGSRQADPSGTANAGEAYVLKGACHWAQAPGPVVEGVGLPLRAFGTPNVPFQLFVAFDTLPVPNNTKFGPWQLSGPIFPILVLPYDGIGEFDVGFPFPAGDPSAVGLEVFMQFLQTPQGEKCDLTNLIDFVIE